MRVSKPREFSSRDEMRRFEQEREDYLMEGIRLCDRSHLGAFYKQLFLETFHPKYRAIKNYYEDYRGGYWRDEHGYICAEHTGNIDIEKITDGEFCIIRDDDAIYDIYVFSNGALIKLCLDEAYGRLQSE